MIYSNPRKNKHAEQLDIWKISGKSIIEVPSWIPTFLSFQKMVCHWESHDNPKKDHYYPKIIPIIPMFHRNPSSYPLVIRISSTIHNASGARPTPPWKMWSQEGWLLGNTRHMCMMSVYTCLSYLYLSSYLLFCCIYRLCIYIYIHHNFIPWSIYHFTVSIYHHVIRLYPCFNQFLYWSIECPGPWSIWKPSSQWHCPFHWWRRWCHFFFPRGLQPARP